MSWVRIWKNYNFSLFIIYIEKKTLVIVHKEFLLNQWIERIKAFLPDAQVGRIQAKTFDIR